MRKVSLTLVPLIIIILSGCMYSGEKVNVIKGSGMANNSLMVGFNELCAGSVEGYIGKSDDVVISLRSGDNMQISVVNTASKDESFLFSFPAGNYTLEVSADRKQLLVNNILYNYETKQKLNLPEIHSETVKKPSSQSLPPSYSFIGDSEVTLVDPFYYINKYYLGEAKNPPNQLLPKSPIPPVTSIGEIKQLTDAINFMGIRIPDIDYLLSPKLIADELKYTFIGYRDYLAETGLYILDLLDRKFICVDSNVKYYQLSPDKKTIAYIKRIESDRILYRICTVNLDGEDKKDIATHPSINGLAWSASGRWLAYSGGDRLKNDIWLIRSDGTQNEQLTHGMFTSGKLSWAQNGDRIAFTSIPSLFAKFNER